VDSWQAPLFDDVVGEQVGAGMAGLDALLLGRKTSKSGAVLLRYALADGTPATGDMTRDDRGA
jgi:hypothetical protein